jgi:hypothetical protein
MMLHVQYLTLRHKTIGFQMVDGRVKLNKHNKFVRPRLRALPFIWQFRCVR